MDPILKHAPQMVRDAIQSMDYAAIDQEAIRKMDNKDLAKWQADRADSLHHQLFANQEWNRRLLEKELKSHRWTTCIGVVATLAGVALGAALDVLLKEPSNSPKIHQQESKPKTTSTTPQSAGTQQNP